MSNRGISTVYIRNLNEKVSVGKLKAKLGGLFEERGFNVLEIITIGNLRLKGQAFITLKDHKQARLATQVFNSVLFLNQLMDVRLANSDSDMARKAKNKNVDIESLKAERLAKRQGRSSENKNKRKRGDEDDETSVVKKSKGLPPMEPNKILLFTGLPNDITEDELISMFKPHKGFLNLTYVSVRNLTLVEFRSKAESSQCINKLGREIVLKGKTCELEFAKK